MPFRHCLIIALLFILGTAPSLAPALEDMLDQSGLEISLESLQAGKIAVEAAADLDDASRTHLLELYENATTQFREMQGVRERLAALDETLLNAPTRIETLNERMFSLEAEMSAMVEKLEFASLEEVEAELAIQQQALTRARESLRQFEDELSRLLAGSNKLSDLIAARSTTLEQYDRERALSSPGESEIARQARLHTLDASRALHLAERAYYRKSAANQSVLIKLAQAEREYWNAYIAALRPRLEQIEGMAQQVRATQAQEGLAEAERLRARAAVLPPELRSIAESNSGFREELEQLVRKQQSVDSDLQGAANQLAEISDDFDRIRQRVDMVGRSMVIGNMLRKRRADLPSLQSHRRDRSVGEPPIDAESSHAQLAAQIAGDVISRNVDELAFGWVEIALCDGDQCIHIAIGGAHVGEPRFARCRRGCIAHGQHEPILRATRIGKCAHAVSASEDDRLRTFGVGVVSAGHDREQGRDHSVSAESTHALSRSRCLRLSAGDGDAQHHTSSSMASPASSRIS